jgi:uncharacterized DUF497 family protein
VLRFKWDPKKAASNLLKHGVTFEEAQTVFADPLAIDIEDPAHSEHEQRFAIVGSSAVQQLIIVAFAEPEENSIRIISARRATPRERRRYEQGG